MLRKNVNTSLLQGPLKYINHTITTFRLPGVIVSPLRNLCDPLRTLRLKRSSNERKSRTLKFDQVVVE